MSNRFYYQQRFRNRLYEKVIHAIEEEAARSGLQRKTLAERIGKSPASLSRILAGPGNWELDTLSDLLFAVGAELDFHVVKLNERTPANHFHPLNGEILRFEATQNAHGAIDGAMARSKATVTWTKPLEAARAHV